jgi:hypothetical protein
MVDATPQGGCVAIPNNTDCWPYYNMTRANELMGKQCPNGYTIVRQQEVVVGQTSTTSTQNDTQKIPVVKGLVTEVQQTSHNTTTVQDRTEWRIWFQKN